MLIINFYIIFSNKWCRSGICVLKTAVIEKYSVQPKPTFSDNAADKSNLIDDRKFGNLMKSEHNFNRLSLVRHLILISYINVNMC